MNSTYRTSIEHQAGVGLLRLVAPVFFVFVSLTASADTLTGTVVKITDGDTLYVLDANSQQHKIRLVPPNPA